MITVEKQNNTEKSYLKLWCQTCRRQLEYIGYGMAEIAPAGVELLDSMATAHERKNHKHDIHIIEGVRAPTNAEIRG